MDYLKQKRLCFCTSTVKWIARTRIGEGYHGKFWSRKTKFSPSWWGIQVIWVVWVNWLEMNEKWGKIQGSTVRRILFKSICKDKSRNFWLEWEWVVSGGWWVVGTNFHLFHRSPVHILKSLTFVLIVECPDHGETSSAGGPVRPGVVGPSGLNMNQTLPDQGIQLLRVLWNPVRVVILLERLNNHIDDSNENVKKQYV